MQKLKISFLSIFTLIAFLTANLIGFAQTYGVHGNQATESFPDVYEGHINYDAINYVKSSGIVEGYPDGNYKASNKINRAEFTKIIVNATTGPDEIAGSNCFPDVKDEWFAKYVCTAKSKNIIEGYPDGNFKPADDILFVEAAKIIAIAFGQPAQDSDPWFKNYVDYLNERLAIPFSINKLDQAIDRGEMAEIIYRLKRSVVTNPSSIFELNGGIATKTFPANFDYGNIDNNVYTNKYFRFTYQLPEGWMVSSTPNLPAPDSAIILMLIGMEGSMFALGAVDISTYPEIYTGKDLLEYDQTLYEEMGSIGECNQEINSHQINGKDFYFVKCISDHQSIPNMDFYVYVEGDSSLIIMIGYKEDLQGQLLVEMMDEINFY